MTNEFGRKALSGEVFIFMNRRRDRVKLLVWDGSGFVIWYMASQLSLELPTEPVGIYAGCNKPGLLTGGRFLRMAKEELKAKVQRGELRILFGTDAASEGLRALPDTKTCPSRLAGGGQTVSQYYLPDISPFPFYIFQGRKYICQKSKSTFTHVR